MDFDQILVEIGEFGRYQKRNYLLICLPVMFAAANSLSYVFTAGIPAYRCLIPQCDDALHPQLNAPWLSNAAPGKNNKNGFFTPDNCNKYQVNSSFVTESLAESCPAEMFNKEISERCFQWVYDEEDRTIVQEVSFN